MRGKLLSLFRLLFLGLFLFCALTLSAQETTDTGVLEEEPQIEELVENPAESELSEEDGFTEETVEEVDGLEMTGESDQPEESEKAGRTAKKVSSDNKWPERLEPQNFEIGLFPNDANGLDFLCDGNLPWGERSSTGIYAAYSSHTSTYAVETVEGTANQREIDLSLDMIKWIFPVVVGDTFSLSLEPGLNIQYDNDYLETYGYRTNADDSITFYRYEATVQQANVSLFSECTMLLGEGFDMDLRVDYFPLIYIHENGNKVYSGLDNPANFTTQNLASGLEISGGFSFNFDPFFKRNVGQINFHAGYYRQYGAYTSENIIVLDNWKTTFVDTENLVKSVITLGGSYDLTPLRKMMRITPSISVLYLIDQEEYGSSFSESSRLKIGFSTKL